MSYHEASHIAGISDSEAQLCAVCRRAIGKPRQFTPGQRVGVLIATLCGAVSVYPIINPTPETPAPCIAP